MSRRVPSATPTSRATRSRQLVATSAALAALAIPIAASAAPAASSARGKSVFTFFTPPKGTDTAPSVLALAGGSDRLVWIDYAASAEGDVVTCVVNRGANKCSSTQNLGPAEVTGAAEPNSGTNPVILSGPNGEIVILAGELYTDAFVSTNNGRTFAPPVAISSTVDPAAGLLTANGQNVIIAGSGNDADAGDLHFVEVSLTGDDLDSAPVVETAVPAAIDDSFGTYKGVPILVAAKENTTTVDILRQTGDNANLASSWQRTTLSDVALPSLATTSKGLLLGAERVTKTATYPVSYLYKNGAFTDRTTLQKPFGDVAFVSSTGTTSVAGKTRYTVTWNIVGGESSAYANYASSSADGKHWVTKRVASSANGVVQSTEASISPDGGGLIVQDFNPHLRAIRLYVGTAISAKAKPSSAKTGSKVAIKGHLLTDLGVAVPGVTVTLKVGSATHTATTSSKGAFSLTVHPAKSESVHLSYAGDDLYDPSTRSVRVAVRK